MTHLNKPRRQFWIGVVLLGFWLTSCKGPAQVGGTVVLYTSVPTDIITEIEAAFEEQYPAVDLHVYRGGTSEVMVRVEEELAALSGGTALACVLRPAGYCLVPQVDSRRITYRVVKSRPDLAEIWPVGWPLKKRLVHVLPGSFEFLNVDIQNYAAADAVNAIGKRLKTPVLYDHNALARHGIDPSKVLVTLPRSRTIYSIALRKLLFQAGLKFEVRCDEAGTPLLWISTIKPL